MMPAWDLGVVIKNRWVKKGDTPTRGVSTFSLTLKFGEFNVFENHIVILESPTGCGLTSPSGGTGTKSTLLREDVVPLLGDKRAEKCVAFFRKDEVTQSIVRIGHRCNKLTVVEEFDEGTVKGITFDGDLTLTFGDSVEDRVDARESWIHAACRANLCHKYINSETAGR